MPSLRTLLSDLAPPSIGNPDRVFFVGNSSPTNQDGGRCCLFCTPVGATKLTFELWGAGGDGQGARCCERGGIMPASGGYAIKTIDAVAGQCYTICAAGSGCGGSCCCGISTNGLPSYVVGITEGTTIACACGGAGGNADITRGGFSGYTCCAGVISNCGFGDFSMPGTRGVHHSNEFCCQSQYQLTSGGLNNHNPTPDMCAGGLGRAGSDLSATCPRWPGGAGTAGRSYGDGYCTGQHGAGGAVKISYS